jgi:hypothetical protein
MLLATVIQHVVQGVFGSAVRPWRPQHRQCAGTDSIHNYLRQREVVPHNAVYVKCFNTTRAPPALLCPSPETSGIGPVWKCIPAKGAQWRDLDHTWGPRGSIWNRAGSSLEGLPRLFGIPNKGDGQPTTRRPPAGAPLDEGARRGFIGATLLRSVSLTGGLPCRLRL